MVKAPAIGIDLGTTYACVAVWQHGKVEIITNDQGNRTTPSYVAFSETERLIGDVARNRMVMNPENTVFDVKRLIGRKYDDPKVQENCKHWPFKVINDFGKPKIEVEYKGEIKQFIPEEVTSMVLTKMRETAESYLGMPVKNAVLTVPAHFNDSQRQATINAATIAGVNVLRLINEPTATALAFVSDKNIEDERNMLIFDLGGGTVDVSVVTIYDGCSINVKSTAGDINLLVHFLNDEVKRKYNVDLSRNARALRRIRIAAERAKHTLSSGSEAVIELEALYLGVDFYTKISRSCFEEICADLFYSTLKLVEKALLDANIDRYEIDDIILVGGSTRIPKIQSLLQDYFCERYLNLSINPDEAVASGAAILAAILNGDTNTTVQGIKLAEVTSLSLGIETAGGIMTNIFGRNTHIPCKRTLIFSTYMDNQSAITIQIFEGVEKLAKNNNLLGTFYLRGISPAFRATPKIEVTFVVDTNGILRMWAEDTSTDNPQSILITTDRDHIKQEAIETMVAEAEKYRTEDEKLNELITIRNHLERYVFSFKQVLSKNGNKLSWEDIANVEKECENCIKWLDNNLLAEKDEYEDWYEQLSSLRNSITVKLYSNNNSEE